MATVALVILLLLVQSCVAGPDTRSVFDQDLYEEVLDPQLCDQQLTLLVNHSLRFTFMDASAKLPSGIFTGNLNDFGDYYQCLDIDELIDEMRIEGKYCAITVPLNQDPVTVPDLPSMPNVTWPVEPAWLQPDNETTLLVERYWKLHGLGQDLAGIRSRDDTVKDSAEARIFPSSLLQQRGMTLGLCVPRVCSPTQAIQFVQNQIPLIDIKFQEFYCRLPNDKPIALADSFAIAIFGLIGLLLVTSTTYDLCHTFLYKKDPSEANKVYRSFSVYTNTRRFLTFNSAPDALECVDGIRAISMMWVIVGHTYAFTMMLYVHNLIDIVDWITSFSSVWINAAPITVDTFFLLSGILAVYSVVGKVTRSQFLRSVHLFYLNRLLRMFPLLAAVVLLQASLFHHVSDGPFWYNAAQAAENCRRWWWAALLHVQNYVNTTEMCLVQTWYLSVDTQLYLASPLVLVCLFSGRSRAGAALLAALILALVASSLYSFLYNFSAALANFERAGELVDYMKLYYMNTLPRAAPFVVGMIYGYMLHIYRGRRMRINKVYAGMLWVLSFLMMSFCILSVYPVLQPGHTAQQLDNFLNAYMRAIWALALGWLIVACAHGYGGPINWFLSLRVWKLPARLSYCMYLVHAPLVVAVNGSALKTHYFTQTETLYRFTSELALSAAAAMLLCITIDAPFSTLQKLIFGGGNKPQKHKTESQETIADDNKAIP